MAKIVPPHIKNKEYTGTKPRPYAEIGERIRAMRTSLGLTGEQFLKGKFPEHRIYMIERGTNAPSIEFLRFLKEEYKASLDFILTGKQ